MRNKNKRTIKILQCKGYNYYMHYFNCVFTDLDQYYVC